MLEDRYRSQTELLVRVLPHVLMENYFALKGGTAINLFHRALPRLSVDIDLTNDERRFLLSFKEGTPQWDWLGVPNADRLPAPAWKQANLLKMEEKKHAVAVQQLRHLLEL